MDLEHEGNLVMHRWTFGRPLSGIHFLAAIILVSSMNCAPTVYDNIPEGHPEPDTYLYETGQAAMHVHSSDELLTPSHKVHIASTQKLNLVDPIIYKVGSFHLSKQGTNLKSFSVFFQPMLGPIMHNT